MAGIIVETGGYKKKYKNKKKYKKYKKYAKYNKFGKLYSKPPLTGLPKSLLVRMRYVQEIGIDCAIGIVAIDTFRANSIYDPYVPLGGHQPMGADQWSAFYGRYTVIGSKISAIPLPTDVQVVPGYYGIIASSTPDLAVISAMTPTELLEQKYVMRGGSKALNFGNSNTNTFGAGSKNQRVTLSLSMKKWFGVKNITDSGAGYSALFNANPNIDCNYSIWVASVTGNDPGRINFLVTIDYIVLLQEPNVLIQS